MIIDLTAHPKKRTISDEANPANGFVWSGGCWNFEDANGLTFYFTVSSDPVLWTSTNNTGPTFTYEFNAES